MRDSINQVTCNLGHYGLKELREHIPYLPARQRHLNHENVASEFRDEIGKSGRAGTNNDTFKPLVRMFHEERL